MAFFFNSHISVILLICPLKSSLHLILFLSQGHLFNAARFLTYFFLILILILIPKMVKVINFKKIQALQW
jgi:hypothetical protein